MFGDLITPPFGWMRQFAKSKVLLGSYSVIQTFFPKVIGDLVGLVLGDMLGEVLGEVEGLCVGDNVGEFVSMSTRSVVFI